MNKIVQFPIVRMLIAILFVGIGIAVGQAALSLVQSLFSITDTGLASPNCGNAPGGVTRIDLQTDTVVGTISIPCAASVGFYQSDMWVGSGTPDSAQLTLIKTD